MKKKTKKPDPCKWCQSLTHRTCRDTECPHHVVVELRPRTRTVTVSLAKRLKNNSIFYVIDEAIKENNKITYNALILLNYYLSYLIDKKEQIPTIDSGLIRQAFSVVSNTGRTPSKNKPSEIMKKCAKKLKIVPIAWTGLVNINSYTIQQIETLISNYNEFALKSHMKKYIRSKFEFTKNESDKTNWFYNRVTTDEKIKAPKGMDEIDELFWEIYIQKEKRIYKKYVNSERFVEYRYAMLKQINIKCEEFPFTLLPLRNEQLKFITLDNVGLNMLKTKLRSEDKKEKAKYFENLDKFFDRKIYYNKKKWCLSKTIKTNGYELHISFDTLNTPRTTTGKMKKLSLDQKTFVDDWNPLYIPPKQYFSEENIVGIDPGNHSVFFWCEKERNNDKYSFKKISKKEFKHKSKQNKLKKYMSKKTAKLKNIFEKMANNSLKTSNLKSLLKASRIRVENYDTCYNIYKQKKIQAIKFERKIAEQKEIDTLLNFISGNGKKLLCFGDGSRMNGIKGTSMGGPVRKIKRHAVKKRYHCLHIDEFRTSKRSNCCGVNTRCMRIINNEGRVKLIRGLLICPNCNKLWNRDANGSINIYKIGVCVVKFYAGIGEEKRPAYLRRGT